jgi:hypothetical protein
MNLLLAVFFVSLTIGLVSPRLAGRAQLAIAAVAIIATALYFIFPVRFM